MIYVGLFLQSFLAALILPFPSEASLLYLKSQSYPAVYLLLAAGFGNSLGAVVNYALGYYAKWSLLEKYLKVKREKVERAKTLVLKRAELLAFFCWLPVFGDFFAVALGFFKMRFISFLLIMSLAKFLRYAVLLFMF